LKSILNAISVSEPKKLLAPLRAQARKVFREEIQNCGLSVQYNHAFFLVIVN
jgi:hypothetical protein